MSQLPRSLLAVLVILFGVVFIYYTQDQSDPCNVQLSNFQRAQRGFLYDQQTKRKEYLEKILPQLKACRESPSLGPCGEMLESVQKLADDLDIYLPQCEPKFATDDRLKKRLQGVLRAMVQLNWGESPPLNEAKELEFSNQGANWMEGTDFKLFCRLWQNYKVLYPEEWSSFREGVLNTLHGEVPDYQDIPNEEGKPVRTCVNCAKTAPEVFGAEKVIPATLFGLGCAK